MTEPLTVEVRTIYALSMPRYIHLQLSGSNAPPPLRIRADSLDQGPVKTVLKVGTETVGEFNTGAVSGWWIEEEISPRAL